WQEAVYHIGTIKPHLKHRLVNQGESCIPEPVTASKIDTSMAEKLLGMIRFIPWQKSIEDTVNCLLEEERRWT
ncbi:hypothetical protein M422DRAFT_272986, partial [Sphaerobolus stellatus SS14]